LGSLSTPDSVQKLQTALHAKAKAEADFRFYALYDKISREDILAHAYAQSRSNKGAPGVDGQDFEDIEGNYPPPTFERRFCGLRRAQARMLTMTLKGFAPLSRAVSIVVRTSASASAAHMAR
jgi:hypothetical protein